MISEKIREVTSALLKEMKEKGGINHGPRAKIPLQKEPQAADLNHGCCLLVADSVVKELKQGEVAWVCDEVYGGGRHPVCHVMVRIDGKCYDSEHPDGIPSEQVADLLQNMERVWAENGWE